MLFRSESKALTEGERAAAQAPQTQPKVPVEDKAPYTPSDNSRSPTKTTSEAVEAAADLLDAVRPAASPPPPARAAVDYYTIISGTVAGLALNNAETRNEVYERARSVVQQRLNAAGPTMSSHMVAVEQIAFDRAVKKIEAEQAELQLTRALSGAKAPAPAADAAPGETAPSLPVPAETVIGETEAV